jgi:hypothetical protein
MGGGGEEEVTSFFGCHICCHFQTNIRNPLHPWAIFFAQEKERKKSGKKKERIEDRKTGR